MEKELEYRFIMSFIIKIKKDRAWYELNNSKKRNSFIWNLPRFIEYKYSEEILESIESDNKLYNILKEKGFSNQCYVVSVDKHIDGTFMVLKSAIHEILGYGPALLINETSNIVFLECEQEIGPPKRFLLKR